jgi:hypothetical protein
VLFDYNDHVEMAAQVETAHRAAETKIQANFSQNKTPILMPKIGVWCLRYFLRRTGCPRICGPVPLRHRITPVLPLSVD